MISFRRKRLQLTDYLDWISSDIQLGWKLLDTAEECLSQSELHYCLEKLEEMEYSFDLIKTQKDLQSIKIQKAKLIRNWLRRFTDGLQESISLYKTLEETYSYAEQRVSISGKQKLQWKIISTEHNLALKAIRFKAKRQFDMVFKNMQIHVAELIKLLEEETISFNLLRTKVAGEIESIALDPLFEYVFEEDELHLIKHTRNELQKDEDDRMEGGPNLRYIQSQVDSMTVKLFARKNQINILEKFDALIRTRSYSGKNHYYVLPQLEEIKDIEDFDMFFRRSIRAVNR